MSKTYITDDGKRITKKNGDYYRAGKKVSPKAVKKHLKSTGTKLHREKECKGNFVDAARKLEKQEKKKRAKSRQRKKKIDKKIKKLRQ